MTKLLINADDFGYSFGVNYGIIDSHVHGILNSATMMMNMPGTEHAIALAKEHPSLRVGIHLVLTCAKPLCTDVPSLVDEEGTFYKRQLLVKLESINLEELEREWTAQIERFLASGLVPTHLDSHHHVYHHPPFVPVIEKLAAKYNLPIRMLDNRFPTATPIADRTLLDFYDENLSMDYFEKLAKTVDPNETVEIMAHPGYVDTELLEGSSYCMQRVRETEILTKCALPEVFELIGR